MSQVRRVRAEAPQAREQETVREGVRIYAEVADLLDGRTLEIVARRRTSSTRRRGWLVRRALVAADVLGLLLAFGIAEAAFLADSSAVDRLGPAIEVLVFVSTLPVWILMAKVHGLYRHDEERADHSTVDDFVGVLHVVTIGAWLVFAAGTLSGVADPDLLKIALFWVAAIAFMTAGRALARAFCHTRVAYLQNAIIVGAGDIGQLIGRKLLQHPEYGINVVGFIDAHPKERRPDLDHLTVLGPPEQLEHFVRLLDVERVIIAFSNERYDELLDAIRMVTDLGVQVDIVPRLFEVIPPGSSTHSVEGIPLVALPPRRLSSSARCAKRVTDVVFAGLALFVLAPLFLLIAISIKGESPGPVVFRQTRRGRGERTFEMYKFRTMVADADDRKHEVEHLNLHATNGREPQMFKIRDDPRITRCGRVLRRFSLDELPQLINVLKGDMSLVGPRPLILEEDELVQAWARKRLQLKPGITGLWQVLGRSEIPFDEMTKLDYLYVATWSLGRDFQLIGRTIPQVIRGRGAY